MFGSLARVPPSGPNGQFRKAIGGNKRGGAGGRVGGPAGRQEAGGSEQACNLHPSSSSPGIWAFLIRLLFCKERGRGRAVITSAAAEANVFWEPSKRGYFCSDRRWSLQRDNIATSSGILCTTPLQSVGNLGVLGFGNENRETYRC